MRIVSILFQTLVLLGLTTASVAAPSELWRNGCPVVLESDLKREGLAHQIGLHYYTERPRGITRKVKERKEVRTKTDKKGVETQKEVTVYDMSYFDPSGRRITDPEKTEWIESLAIPPRHENVWISPDPDSHILAIGYDVKLRPQYAYHPRWIEATSVTKFLRMREFGKHITAFRKKALTDLQSPNFTKEKLLAAAAVILETGSIRVGSEKYVTENGSYGLTTLLKSQVEVKGPVISFDFIGKEGIHHAFTLDLPEVAPVIESLLALPGTRVFQYFDEKAIAHGIQAADIKKYLEEIGDGTEFTAKDFRTWQGTTAAAKKLIELGPPVDEKDAEAKILEAVTYTSSILRNKPNTARENYIHPRVLSVYLERARFLELLNHIKGKSTSDLRPEERFVLELLDSE